MFVASLLAISTLTLAACSSGPGSSSSVTTTSSSVDRAAMTAVLLRASDLPNGWVESPKASSSNEAETRKAAQGIPACSAFVAQADIEKRYTNLPSSTFADSAMSSDAASNVSNQVVGYPSEPQAKTAYGVYAGAQMSTCLQQIFDKLVKEQVTSLNAQGGPAATVTAEVQRLGVPAAGDAATAYQVTVTIEVAGQTQQLGFVVQIVRVGQYIVSYNATLYQAAPDKFGENLVDRSIARIEASLVR